MQKSLWENAKVLQGNANFLERMQKFCEWAQKMWKICFIPPKFFSNLQSTAGVTSGSATSTVYFILIIQDYFNNNNNNNKVNI